MKIPKVPIQGNCRETTIVQANIAQPLVNARSLVRSVTVMPHPDNSGTVTMSLGPSPLMPSLYIDAGPSGWVDLQQIQIKGTNANDKVVFQSTYAP